MKREFLEGLGLEKENIDKIMAENGRDIENTKANLSTKETELANTKKLLEDANNKIESFKDLNIDEIKAEAEKHKLEAEETKRKADEEIESLKFNHELESAIRDSKAKNIKAVKALLDIENLKGSKNRLEDIKQALDQTKADNDYMFTDADSTGTGGSLGNGGKNKVTLTKDKIMEIGDPIERKRKIAENLELFN